MGHLKLEFSATLFWLGEEQKRIKQLLWLPPVVQVPLTSKQGDRVRSSVRPVRAAFPETAGREGDLRNGSASVSLACALTVAI